MRSSSSTNARARARELARGMRRGEHRRHLDDAEPRLVPLVLAREHDAEVEALVAHVRERVPGVDRDRREDREDLVVEALVEGGELVGRELVGLDEHRRRRAASAGMSSAFQQLVLRVDELVGARADRGELLVRRQPVGRQLVDLARELLLEAGDAHHEELVEVRGDDREELEPLESGTRRVVCLGEDARVELEPGELAVQVERGRVERRHPDGAAGTACGGGGCGRERRRTGRSVGRNGGKRQRLLGAERRAGTRLHQ